jgi:hypothetical protein
MWYVTWYVLSVIKHVWWVIMCIWLGPELHDWVLFTVYTVFKVCVILFRKTLIIWYFWFIVTALENLNVVPVKLFEKQTGKLNTTCSSNTINTSTGSTCRIPRCIPVKYRLGDHLGFPLCLSITFCIECQSKTDTCEFMFDCIA